MKTDVARTTRRVAVELVSAVCQRPPMAVGVVDVADRVGIYLLVADDVARPAIGPDGGAADRLRWLLRAAVKYIHPHTTVRLDLRVVTLPDDSQVPIGLQWEAHDHYEAPRG